MCYKMELYAWKTRNTAPLSLSDVIESSPSLIPKSGLHWGDGSAQQRCGLHFSVILLSYWTLHVDGSLDSLDSCCC